MNHEQQEELNKFMDKNYKLFASSEEMKEGKEAYIAIFDIDDVPTGSPLFNDIDGCIAAATVVGKMDAEKYSKVIGVYKLTKVEE